VNAVAPLRSDLSEWHHLKVKRYRVLSMDFDMRANILSLPAPEPASKGRELGRRNTELIIQGLVAQYGTYHADEKTKNFIDLGASPISVVAFHNVFFRQARDAFVMGAYYPALTAICALGERVLNHLVLKLRDEFQATPEYKEVYRKDSFDNWDLAIDTLEAWRVLLPEAAALFRKLKAFRNRTIHFNPETEQGTRDIALDALKIFHGIIDKQFSGFGGQPWYIPDAVGVSFVRKAAESEPFVAHVILPSCTLVGPAHRLEHVGDGHLVAVDPTEYPDREVTDEEFIELFKQGHTPKATS